MDVNEYEIGEYLGMGDERRAVCKNGRDNGGDFEYSFWGVMVLCFRCKNGVDFLYIVNRNFIKLVIIQYICHIVHFTVCLMVRTYSYLT